MSGKEVWHERAIMRFIQFLPPKRLTEVEVRDVTEWLTLMASQPTSEGWRIQQASRALRLLHYAYRTEETYLGWAVRFLRFCGERPAECLGAEQVRDFLEDLAVRGKVAASTQNQALNALVFFFREGLGRELGQLGRFEPAKRPRRLPVVLTAGEVSTLLRHVEEAYRLMVQLLYGCGLRLMECVRLRVQDIDFERGQIMVRGGKGAKDRVVMLPEAAVDGLGRHLERARQLYELDVRTGCGEVHLPDSVRHKYPGAGKEWA